jgi:hypothetical protein
MNALVIALALMTSPCSGGQCARPRPVVRSAPPVQKFRAVRPVRKVFPRLILRFPNVG